MLDYKFSLFEIYNYNRFGQLKYFFEFIKKNHKKYKGDIVEAGVHKGKSLLSIGLFLKELNSKKKVYGYDTFSGFPKKQKNHEMDHHSQWKNLLNKKNISKQHYKLINENYRYLSFIKKKRKKDLNSFNTSLSSDFSNPNLSFLKKKIKYLELNNIKLIKGEFKKTIPKKLPKKIFAALIDADLYSSYETSLPYIWKNLVKGGYIFFDEYYSLKFPGPRIFCDYFFKKFKEKPIMHRKIRGDFERWYIRKKF